VVAVRVVAFAANVQAVRVTPSPSDVFPSTSVSVPIEALKSPVTVAMVEAAVTAPSDAFKVKAVTPSLSTPAPESVILKVPAL
jgi:hypothetical protein